jgi:putative FmdB family regulatory protein
MPQIEYQCRRCGKQFERVVLAGEEENLPVCPACGDAKVKKAAGATPIFKGIASFSSLAQDRN